MKRPLVHLLCALSLAGQMMPASLAASQPELNFKIYSPETQGATKSETSPAGNSGALTPKSDDSVTAPAAQDKPAAAEKPPATSDSLWSTDNSQAPTNSSAQPAPASSTAESTSPTPPADTAPDKTAESQPADATADSGDGAKVATSQKALKGYIRVVPSGTKIPIIMDTSVDSDTSQEGDEFSARTGEDLNIDGSTVVPAGSIIKGRIAQLNAPKNMGRGGSVALKFDTVTTPDNRQIPLVANLVAHGGVVHAKRGVKDIAIDAGTATVPALLGLGIGVLAGSSKSGTSGSSHISKAEGAMIGAGIGAAVGIAILLIKKGKKIDVRPGDELKIELAEDLRMPM
ncbi:MAG TPA: hypothetical protein V6D22_24125 [Candidatus Obscuribacterales bacterium]